MCEPVEGVEELFHLPDRPMLVFGELHGTDRGPAAFGSVVCHLAREHEGLTVGLEISHTEQERIDAYMASRGMAEDREDLLAGPFWTDPYQDGRRSRAMAELIERLRALDEAGNDIEVVAFDPLPDAAPARRDELMAANLLAVLGDAPHAPLVALAGNFHPRTAAGTPWDESFVPMGAWLERARGVEVLPLDIRHAGGTAWICTGGSPDDCGPRSVRGVGLPRSIPLLEFFPEPETVSGYAAALWVGEVEASPPAVEGGGVGGHPGPGSEAPKLDLAPGRTGVAGATGSAGASLEPTE